MNNCEKTAKLLKLASENPELPIIFTVDNEVVPNDEYGWYLGSMSSCRVDEYAILNEMVLCDRDDFKERYYDYNYDELDEMFPRIVKMGMRNLKSILTKLQMEISKPQSLFQYLLIRNKK